MPQTIYGHRNDLLTENTIFLFKSPNKKLTASLRDKGKGVAEESVYT